MTAVRFDLCALTTLFALAGAPACTTESKTKDGTVTASLDASTTSDAAPRTESDAVDLMDAGAVRDAGSLDAGIERLMVDAGTKPTATATSTPTEKPKQGTSTPFDRILVKPKVLGDVATVQALVERSTGLKLALVRRTAGKWLLLQFAPTAAGRDQSDQAQLVEQLTKMDEFASVEGDRLMKLKQP